MTSDLVFGVAELVAFGFRAGIVHSGDPTGTPARVGFDPPRFLKPWGIDTWVEGIGQLPNQVVVG
ncbi:MAG TPA: hypothetical protein VLB67_06345 [Acidimicrobiia bacterium]|nr:hypothetical protein [Acidimicrobiia bacterium]